MESAYHPHITSSSTPVVLGALRRPLVPQPVGLRFLPRRRRRRPLVVALLLALPPRDVHVADVAAVREQLRALAVLLVPFADRDREVALRLGLVEAQRGRVVPAPFLHDKPVNYAK